MVKIYTRQAYTNNKLCVSIQKTEELAMAYVRAMSVFETLNITKTEDGVEKFYALHPFSKSCENIWEFDRWMWFTNDELYQAQQDV